MSEVVPMKGDKRKPIEVLHVRTARGFRVDIQKYRKVLGCPVQKSRIDLTNKDSRGIVESHKIIFWRVTPKCIYVQGQNGMTADRYYDNYYYMIQTFHVQQQRTLHNIGNFEIMSTNFTASKLNGDEKLKKKKTIQITFKQIPTFCCSIKNLKFEQDFIFKSFVNKHSYYMMQRTLVYTYNYYTLLPCPSV